jgi:hypothetical protein
MTSLTHLDCSLCKLHFAFSLSCHPGPLSLKARGETGRSYRFEVRISRATLPGDMGSSCIRTPTAR